MKLIKNIIVSFPLLFQIASANCQNKQALNSYLSNLYRNHIMPGFSVVVVQKGKIVFSQGYGVESIGSGKPFTPQTVSAIGSLTKSMTAMAMMQLVEQKKIDLDKPVITYLPWFQTANKEMSDRITVRMLLNNTSGLYSNIPWESEEASENSLEYLVRSLKSVYLTREPGLAYQYSNVGFSVAGLIISKVSGEPYSQYMQNKIFTPLKMVHTSTDVSYIERLGALQGHYYGLDKAIPAMRESHLKPDGYMPAGSILCSTTEDLAKYLLALMGDNAPVSKASIDAMWKQNISFPGLTKQDGGDGANYGYGLGWMISNIEGNTIIHHGGSTGKMSSFTMIDIKNQTAVSILVNIDLSFVDKYRYATEVNIINNIRRLALGLETSSFGMPTVKDPTINNYTLNDTLAKNYTGDYILKSDNVNFLYAGAQMTISASKNNQPECIIYRGKQVINRFVLDFENEAFAVSRNTGAPSNVRFKLNPDKKVSGLFFADMEFIRADKATGTSRQEVNVDKTLSFAIPSNWKVAIGQKTFSAQSPDKKTELKGVISESADSILRIQFDDQYINAKQVEEVGLPHVERVGTYQWKEKSYVCKIDGVLKHVITLQAAIGNRSLSLALMCPPVDFTKNIQQVINLLLNSVNG